MQKLDMLTPDMVSQNMEAIAQLFPNIITEQEDTDGNVTKAIDYDLFRQMFSRELVEGSEERYRLDWPGKRASILKANTPINKTLRPVVAESVNWDTTENLYIEGDNFEVLKVLQESYLGKVKMIYIDPPYNTGKDFVYSDDYSKKREEEMLSIGAIDDERNRLFKPEVNTDTNGRFHSDWLSMMYERLVVARDLLTEDGVVFMSIDDNEVHNLKKISDEIFGEENFIGIFSVENNPKGRKNGKFISVTNEFCIAYAKITELATFEKIIPKHASDMAEDENGDFVRRSGKRVLMGENFLNGVVSNFNSAKHYTAYIKDSDLILKQENSINEFDKELINNGYIRYITFRENTFVENTYTKEKFQDLFKEGSLDIRDNKIYEKHFSDMMQIKSMLTNNEYEAIVDNKKVTYKIDLKTTSAKQQLTELFNGEYFSFPKNISFLSHLISLINSDSAIILDFFSGSASTAHAVMQVNAEDGGNRKFIMVQIPEETDKDSEAYKAGYANICEIGKERIRRAGKKILEENKNKEGIENLDTGFRVYRLDSSNMKDVFYHPTEVTQAGLFDLTSNIKDDRTPEDILAQVMLDLGLTLDLPIETRTIAGSRVFLVAGNSLVACFDEEVDFSIVDALAQFTPLKVVFRDSSFQSDADRINFETRFKKLSPDSDLRVI